MHKTMRVAAVLAAFTMMSVSAFAQGGGALFDLGAHPLALVVLLARPATVTQVSARLVMGTEYRTDEHADVELTFSDGCRGRVVASWQAGPESQ